MPAQTPCDVGLAHARQATHTDSKLIGGNREEGEGDTVLNRVTHSGGSARGGLYGGRERGKERER